MTHSISETEGKFRDVSSGMREADGGGMPIYTELTFCFPSSPWRLGHSGLRGQTSVREREVSCQVLYQAAVCGKHDKRHIYMGESGHKAAEGAAESPLGPVSEVTEPDVVHSCREEQWNGEYSRPVILQQPESGEASCDILPKCKNKKIQTDYIFTPDITRTQEQAA